MFACQHKYVACWHKLVTREQEYLACRTKTYVTTHDSNSADISSLKTSLFETLTLDPSLIIHCSPHLDFHYLSCYSGCWSYVGRVFDGKQQISLKAPSCVSVSNNFSTWVLDQSICISYYVINIRLYLYHMWVLWNENEIKLLPFKSKWTMRP